MRPTGFDYMRIILSISIICFHSILVSYGPLVETKAWVYARPFYGMVLPMFFALSGFLVCGSLERTRTLVGFVGLRFLRLIPALAVEVVLSALILGAFFTNRSLPQYVHDPEFRRYFLNIVGDIHYLLPGVFDQNPMPGRVNQQLWTIPWELKCYVVLSVLSLIGLMRFRWGSLILAFFSPFALVALNALHHRGLSAGVMQELSGHQAVSGAVLVASFLAGVSLFRLRDRITINPLLFFSSLIISVLLLKLPFAELLCPIPSAYVTIYIGVMRLKLWSFLKTGDYSYGIYLFGFAIQQAVAAIGSWTHHWWLNIAIALPITVLIAIGSWHLVEKPALKLRSKLSVFEDNWINWTAGWPWARLEISLNKPLPNVVSPRDQL